MGEIPGVIDFYPSSLECAAATPGTRPKHNKEQQCCKANRTIARMADWKLADSVAVTLT